MIAVRVRGVTAAAVAVVMCGIALPLGAQAPAEVWERSLELSGNYLYGNNDQAILSTRAGVVRNDSTVQIRLDGRYLIGVTSREKTGRVMDRRSWIISASSDFRPYAAQSQFFFGSVERSLELRIRRRASGGIGQKVVIRQDSVTRFDASLGVLGEHSLLPQVAAAGAPPVPDLSNSLIRLSGRVRYRRSFNRVGLEHTTWYRPEIAAFNRYLASSVSAFSYAMGRGAKMQLSLQNDFDSLARSRGARSNQNGQILVGASTKF